MADKTYRFGHRLGGEEARRRIRPVVEDLCRTYGLNLEAPATDRLSLTRSGVTADVAIGDQEVAVRVELNWFLEKSIRKQVEDRLHQMFPEVLKSPD